MSQSIPSIQPAAVTIKPQAQQETKSQAPISAACPTPPVQKRLRDEFRKALLVQGKAQRTIDSYVESVTKFHEFHNGLNPLKATANHIRAYLYHLKVERNYAARTFNLNLYGLKAFYSIFMPDVPLMDSFNRLRVKEGEYSFISRREFDAMMESTQNVKHQAILSVLFGTGVRVSECAGLIFSDINRSEGLIRVRGKGDKIRYTILPQTTLQLLGTYYREYKPKQYVFEGQGNKPLTTTMIELVVRHAAARAGIKKKSPLTRFATPLQPVYLKPMAG